MMGISRIGTACARVGCVPSSPDGTAEPRNAQAVSRSCNVQTDERGGRGIGVGGW